MFDMEVKLQEMLGELVNEYLEQIILSRPAGDNPVRKVKIKPVALKDEVYFQAEEFKEKQAFHRNMDADGTRAYITDALAGLFRQAEVKSRLGSGMVLIGKKGTMTVKYKRSMEKTAAVSQVREHNRKKRYLLEEGTPVEWLVDLGIMTGEGQIVRSRYDKFRQINRFLEFIEDILPKLSRERENVIIDFGCGKSYLTFAMYYYLHEKKGYPIRIIGLDLKKDVIERCNRLAGQYGFEKLAFYHGDIASYEGVSQVDMVVTLHACDTATDYAIEKAVKWNASVILSVPCCQHEWNQQIENELLAPVLQYGLIKERMAALYTDAIRAEILEHQGYRTQILEFIDMEHTPKNLLIRAVRDGRKKDNRTEIEAILGFLHTEPALYRLLMKPGLD